MSARVYKTESPHIDDVLEKYSNVPDLTMLALGSVYWNPPQKAVDKLAHVITNSLTHKYGDILGLAELREHLTCLMQEKGKDPFCTGFTNILNPNSLCPDLQA